MIMVPIIDTRAVRIPRPDREVPPGVMLRGVIPEDVAVSSTDRWESMRRCQV